MTHAKNIFTYMLALFSTLAIVGCSFEEDHADCQGKGEGEKMQEIGRASCRERV